MTCCRSEGKVQFIHPIGKKYDQFTEKNFQLKYGTVWGLHQNNSHQHELKSSLMVALAPL